MEHCNYGYRAGVPGKVQTQGVYIHIVYLQTKVGSVLFGVIKRPWDDPMDDPGLYLLARAL